jgi:hypothetical protein
LASFREATGRDFESDAEVHALLVMLRLGLDEARQPGATRLEARAGEGSETVYVRPPKRPGPPTRPVNVTRAISTLVDLLKPGPAALAVAIAGLHRHPGFVGDPLPTRGFDVGDLLRTIAQRLSAVAKECAGHCTDSVPRSVETGTPGGTP